MPLTRNPMCCLPKRAMQTTHWSSRCGKAVHSHPASRQRLGPGSRGLGSRLLAGFSSVTIAVTVGQRFYQLAPP